MGKGRTHTVRSNPVQMMAVATVSSKGIHHLHRPVQRRDSKNISPVTPALKRAKPRPSSRSSMLQQFLRTWDTANYEPIQMLPMDFD